MAEGSEGGACTRGTLFVLCLIAWGLSVVAIADCSFLLIDTPYDTGGGGGGGRGTSRPLRDLEFSWDDMDGFGMFSQDVNRDEHYCVPYNDYTFDEIFNTAGKAGRGFGVAAAVLSGLMMVLYTALLVFLEKGVTIVWRICLGLILVAIPSQFLTFLVMLVEGCKDYDCMPGIAGGASIISGVLFIVMAIMMGCCARPPSKPLVSISEMRNQNKMARWTELVLSVITFILAVVVVADCTFLRADDRSKSYKNLDEFGLFNYNIDSPNEHRCLAYSGSTSFSASERTARAFGILATIFSGIAMLQMTGLNLFFKYKAELMWKMIRVQLVMAIVSQALTFTVFGDSRCADSADTKCVVGPVGIIAGINVLLLFTLACLCWGTAPPKRPLFKIVLADQGEDEEETLPDKGDVLPQMQEQSSGYGVDEAVYDDQVYDDQVYDDQVIYEEEVTDEGDYQYKQDAYARTIEA